MANSAQARKRARQAEKTRQRNAGLVAHVRRAVGGVGLEPATREAS